MKKLIKPKLIKSDEINFKIYTLKEKIKIDWSQWNIIYIPEEIKPAQFKNKTMVISTLAKPKKYETFLEFMKRISNENLIFILEGSKIIHFDELKKSFNNDEKRKPFNATNTTKLCNHLS